MSRPIPVEVIPSHVHLSEDDQATLFGGAFASTIAENLSQSGQYAYSETLDVSGRLKRSLRVRVLGPCRRDTQVELTPTEAQLLGIDAPVAKSGDHSDAGSCTLRGPEGTVTARAVVPQPHLHCSDVEAAQLHVHNGKIITIDFDLDRPCTLTDVVVRVHPTYHLRLHIHQDIARDYWLTGVVHGRIREAAL